MSLKVSIIIPTYNQAKYLGQCIQSALDQDYPDKEVIVSDDCSTDQTEEIVKLFLKKHPQLRFFRNGHTLGRTGNYKTSLNNYASGDLALILDGDDYFTDSGYIKNAVGLFEKNPELVLVFANSITFFEPDGSFIVDKVNSGLKGIIDGNWLFINFYRGYSIPHLTCLYKRKEAVALDFYRENIQSSDWESILRLLIGHKVAYLNKCVGVWRKHGLNESLSIGEKDILSNLKYIENAFDFARQSKQFEENELEKSRKGMLKRYFFRILVQTAFFAPDQMDRANHILKDYSSDTYKAVVFGFRYGLFQQIRRFDFLLLFIAKYIQKQESMYKDLKLFRKKA